MKVPSLDELKQLAEGRKDENYEFRLFLKNLDIPEQELDTRVKELADSFFKLVDCKKCANCCRTLTISYTEEDVGRLCRVCGMGEEQFKERYLAEMRDGEPHLMKEKPCPFLAGNLCTHYEARPGDCSGYPYLHKHGFTTRLYAMIQNYGICPVVYLVFETLKKDFS